MAFGKWSRRLVALSAVLGLIFIAAGVVAAQDGFAVPEGTTLVVQLEQSVRADRVKAGDQFRAKLLAPMLKDGKTVLPKEATVLGLVVEAEPLASLKPSRLLIRFYEARWKQGSAELNAYLIRYLVLKRSYGYESRELCPPVQRFQMLSQFQQSSSQSVQQKPTPPPAPAPPPPPSSSEPSIPHSTPRYVPLPNVDDLCQKPYGTKAENEPLVFTSPTLTDIVLRKLDSPSGATVLESNKKNVSLPKGMIWEIRQTDIGRL